MAAIVAAIVACAPAKPAADTDAAPPTAAQFAGEIAAFDSANRASPPDSGSIVFTGSSSIRLWETLASDFPGMHVLNRGFGGSTLPDVVYYAPRAVLPARPSTIVLYAGDNDIAAGRSPLQVLEDYRAFVRTVRQALPGVRILYISIKPSPSRWQLVDRIREANARIAVEISRDTLARFVNVYDPMMGPNGYPRPELFRDDSLHMTAAGYAIWRERVGRLLAPRP